MYQICIKWLNASPRDTQLEKRAFRIIQVLLDAESAECRKFVAKHSEEILELMTKPLPKGTPPSVIAVSF
jgi:RNAse (barnase) inhibitor barstar